MAERRLGVDRMRHRASQALWKLRKAGWWRRTGGCGGWPRRASPLCGFVFVPAFRIAEIKGSKTIKLVFNVGNRLKCLGNTRIAR